MVLENHLLKMRIENKVRICFEATYLIGFPNIFNNVTYWPIQRNYVVYWPTQHNNVAYWPMHFLMYGFSFQDHIVEFNWIN